MNQNTVKIRRTIFIIVLGLLVLTGWIVFTSIRDQGTVTVSLIRAPFNSKVLLDNVEVGGSTIKLKPGTYTFDISRDGFYPKEVTAVVDTKGDNSVTFALSPESEDAKKLVETNEKYHYDHTLSGGDIIDPVLDVLPIRNVVYSVDSEARQEAFPKTPLTITITASKGYRNTAIQALGTKGIDLSNYLYSFSNYKDVF